ncbi:dinuclear metal center protein, YbgI/SA1388 family [Catalinimonas alkaloidigena]|uniref:GTP cyclohydrolase 1 type 2 homolog n=1 Tax=Catalinimonas alkaloidigena TaxID=1075417 RepID=A0A1G9S2M6_9BACT|nr:Nif3-like dinuclear metal center hexameric protein [Catalinimonas alkaloidigena]SDM29530.1 dinuclear metal center protein, YbgI/SA1388 family [Catalinimonas alkaloidigena]
MKIKEVLHHLEALAPPALQESYDNAGLITGHPDWEVTGALLTLDCTEPVIEEALQKSCNLIIAHHPIVFRGLKSLTGRNYVERTVITALKNDIAVYAIHTNLDHVHQGVNARIAQRLGLQQPRILSPKEGMLLKLTVFVPRENSAALREALHQAGAGNIGNYSECSFRTDGMGTFRPNERANPHLGTHHHLEEVQEERIEVILPTWQRGAVLSAMRQAHPYEEVAYYLSPLENTWQEVGAGMIGTLPTPLSERDFLAYLKEKMQLQVIRHTALRQRPVERVAVCGGAGSFLLKPALRQQADVLVTADFKYHEFFDADGKIVIADIGHFESETFTRELLGDYLSEKIANFATYFSETPTNPVHYFF